MDTTQKKKQVELSLGQKVELLTELESKKCTQSDLSAKFGISRSSVSRIVQQKDKILRQFRDGYSLKLKRKRMGSDEDLDEALIIWYRQKSAEGIRVSGPLIQSKAIQLATLHGLNNFHASSGWLWRWKKRHNVAFRKQQGEKLDPDEESVALFLREIMPDILREFPEDDIFNADETSLYFRAFSVKGHCSKDELTSGKVANERITVLLCSNMTGTDKRPLLIVGMSERPRCFPEDLTKLPVEYTYSSNAWMTEDIFTTWLTNWDSTLRLNDRHILLLVDNCSSHPKSISLTNITLLFLPTNTTTVIQPFDQGIIKNWKGHYRAALNSRIILALDTGENQHGHTVAKKVNLLDALNLAKLSWAQVKSQTIANCFRKAGFLRPCSNICENVPEDPLHDILIPSNFSYEEFSNFISIDDNVQTSGVMSDSELLLEAEQKRIRETDEGKQSNDDTGDNELPMTKKERKEFIDLFRKFVHQEGIDYTQRMSFQEVESIIQNQVN